MYSQPELPRPHRAYGYPLLTAIPLAVDVSLVILFTAANYKGGLVALGMGLLCIPFAIIAHRARRRG